MFVRLISDEYVAVGKPGILYRSVELIEAVTGDAELPVLPDDVSRAVDQHYAVVGAAVGIGAVGGFGLTPGGARAGHQSEIADARGIVDTDDRRRREICRAQAKLPNDLANGIDFNHTIVELVGYQILPRELNSLSCGVAEAQPAIKIARTHADFSKLV